MALVKVLVHRLSNDNTLAALDTSASPTSTISPSFLPGTLSYTLRVAAAVSTINIYATFSYTKVQATSPFQYQNSGGTYTSSAACGGSCVMGTGSLPALPLLSGDNIISMTIVPEDGSPSKTYTLTIHRSSSLATAQMITFAGLSLSPGFSTSTFSYTMSVPSGTSSTTVTVTPTYGSAFCQYTFNMVTGTYVSLTNSVASTSFALPYGDIEIDVNCISEDGLGTQLYSIKAHRLAVDSAMKSLTVSSSAISPTFASGTHTYSTITTDAAFSAQVITNNIYATFAYVFNGGASVPVPAGTTTISGLLPHIGANTLVITVRSEDLSSSTTYTLNIKKLDTNSYLASLTTNRGPPTPAFSATTQDYSLLVTSSTTTIQITAVTASTLASGGYALFYGASPTIQQTPTTATLSAYPSYIALPAGGVTPDVQLAVSLQYKP